MRIRLSGITIELSYPLVAVMTLVMIYDTSLSVLICFIAVIIHESGHLTALHIFSSFPDKIRLTLFDIAISDKKKSVRSFRQELIVVVAGIAANIISALITFILNCILPCSFFEGLMNANISLAVFNSLPIDSLDGGQALLMVLCEKTDIYKAMTVLDIISFLILIPIAALGFLVVLRSRYNFTLLLTSMYLMALLILKHKRE